ncbi:hypothetical protein L2E82_10222 [Cichorium intybus]|uniref:Uncharacterized protein n=1 Tax=Cichorium intybus TaxID=13427 RepID=A0ACB9GAZ5_CICIN|nr:hypothetical protein L2E82_10222 [Cichorium intybus]
MVVPQLLFLKFFIPILSITPAESVNAVDATTVDDPPSAGFTWTIENFFPSFSVCSWLYRPPPPPPLRPHLEETTIDIGGGWQISGTPMDLNDPRLLEIAEPECQFLEAEYEDINASNASGAAFCRLTMRSEEIGAAVEAWPVGLFGLASILLLSPLFSKIIMQLHFRPQEFVTGLALFSCMPITLSGGVALTRPAGGNSALALAMTVLSSLLGKVPWIQVKLHKDLLHFETGYVVKLYRLARLSPSQSEFIEGDVSNGASLFAAINNSISKKGMSLYIKEMARNEAITGEDGDAGVKL